MKVLTLLVAMVLLGMFGCVACVDALLPVTRHQPAPEVAPSQEIAAPEVPRDHPRGSFSRVGGDYHQPYTGWAEVNAAAAEADAAVRAAEAARPAPPVVVVNVEVQQPRRHWWGHRHHPTQPVVSRPARRGYQDPPPLWPASR